MEIITALDLAGVKTHQLDKWTYRLACPWCGEEAWAASDYLHCSGSSCPTKAASPEDVLARAAGSYKKGAQMHGDQTGQEAKIAEAEFREKQRRVMDLWVSFCNEPGSTECVRVANKLQQKGQGIRQSQYNARVLDAPRLARLIEVAEDTGASYPDSWKDSPPTRGTAIIVQSTPHTIDRIILVRRNNWKSEIVWNDHVAGISCLLGLHPSRARLLVADFDVAMMLQHHLNKRGVIEEVASIYLDSWRGHTCPDLDFHAHLLTATPRQIASEEEAKKDPLLLGVGDIERMHRLFNHFPGITEGTQATTMALVVDIMPRRPVPWDLFRCASVADLIPPGVDKVPPAAATLLEKTGCQPQDISELQARFNNVGRYKLAAHLDRVARTRILYEAHTLVVKETATDYRMIHQHGVTTISNFTLQITNGVMFANQTSDSAWCQGTLRCGTVECSVLFPQSVLHMSSLGNLEADLQRQLAAHGLVEKAGKLPQVINAGHFRKYVMQHIRAMSGTSDPIAGVDRLGWSADRKKFVCPGYEVTKTKVKPTSTILCPNVSALRYFEAVPVWSESCPKDIDPSCQDLIAMLLANSVRYFRRCVTKPVLISQVSNAMTTLETMIRAAGQASVYELNQNQRAGGTVEGVHGYPILAAGPRTVTPQGSQEPYLHLTDTGYRFPSKPTTSALRDGARALQYALHKSAKWCLETGADDFELVRSLQYHRSLLREGQWLMEHACEIPGWKVSESEPTALEKLLEQIPYEEAPRRITLVDGENLVIDVTDLQRDRDEILREGQHMGSTIAIEDDQLFSSAVKLLPAISTYYGQDPDVRVVTT